jgi:hypothetical protein
VILLLGGGLALSVTGAVMGFDWVRKYLLMRSC